MGCASSAPQAHPAGFPSIDAPTPTTIINAAAQAALYDRRRDDTDGSQKAWLGCDGARLEAALRIDEELGDSPMKLLDARFLIELYKRGGTLRRRQELPATAFLTLEEVKQLPKGGQFGDCLRICCASHPWHQPDCADPKGINLARLARFLEVLVSGSWSDATYAILFDYASLHQAPPQGERTATEEELYRRSLTTIMHWYAHPKVMTLKLTELPPGYPNGFTFPQGVTPNASNYFDRGWCFCESMVSAMCKASNLVVDLGKFTGAETDLGRAMLECAATRPPPLMPTNFESVLSTETFSKKADEKIVAQLYADVFEEEMGKAEKLRYSKLKWGDEEVAVLCKVLASGTVRNLNELVLGHNEIGDAGCAALAQVIRSGAVPKLARVDLYGNPASAAAMQSVRGAIASRK